MLEDMFDAIDLVRETLDSDRVRVRISARVSRNTAYSLPAPDEGGVRLLVMHPAVGALIGARDGDWIVRDASGMRVVLDTPAEQLERMRRQVLAQAVRRFDMAIAALGSRDDGEPVWCPTCRTWYGPESAHAFLSRRWV